MIRYLKIISLTCLLFLAAGIAWAAADDCEIGKGYYNQARHEIQEKNDLGRAETLLQQSIKVCPSFQAWYLLGRVLSDIGSLQESIEAFEMAMSLAADSKNRALAMGRVGQVMFQQSKENTADAIVYLKNGVKLHPDPPAWMTVLLQDLEIQQGSMVITAEKIMRSLDPDATRNFGVTPSINLRVHFETDDYSLTSHSRQQVVELGKAMASKNFQDRSFILIGHTDQRGSREYNLNLSEKRAETVYNELVRLYPELSGRLKTEGRGEDDLLYSGDTEKIHSLNRRLEVTFLH